MKKFDIMNSIRREMNLKNLSSSRVAKKIGISEMRNDRVFPGEKCKSRIIGKSY